MVQKKATRWINNVWGRVHNSTKR